ncbi:MAG: hypothetical protein MPJ78_19235 [Hyphomicrobiaceae bacterium]|nr:hypothetical protein [Hyphomicrobiaceae bacterium]
MTDHQVLTFGRVVAEQQLIWLHCQSCPRGVEILAGALTPGIPSSTPFPEIVRYLKCSRCGGKAIDVMPEIYPGGFLGDYSRFGIGTRALVPQNETPLNRV